MTVDTAPRLCIRDESPDSRAVRDRAHLGAMRHYAQLATKFAKDWKPDSEEEDRVTFLAIAYCLGIIGGAACQVSAGAIPAGEKKQWPRVMALRDRIIKEYRTVTPALIFGIVQQDLPPLVAVLEMMPEARPN